MLNVAMRASVVVCIVVGLAVGGCSSQKDPSGAPEDTHFFEHVTLQPLSPEDGITDQSEPSFPAGIYDVSEFSALWGEYGQAKEYALVIPLFVIADEYSPLPMSLYPPAGYNKMYREYDAPASTADYVAADWPDIRGVVDAKTRVRMSRLLLIAALKNPELSHLVVEGEILDGPWKGTRVDLCKPGFATFTELYDVSFRLHDVGVIRVPEIHTYGPDAQFLRPVAP